MKFTDYDLEVVIRAAIHMRQDAQSEQSRRSMQRKVDAQRKEIVRLTDRVKDLERLSHSRGQLILDIQRRAMQRQVTGDSDPHR